jgi:hypothetical protein
VPGGPPCRLPEVSRPVGEQGGVGECRRARSTGACGEGSHGKQPILIARGDPERCVRR